ncbi:hypothetical protein PQ472_11360 [Lacticaseibacillus pabuli]|uniref:Surface layer protein A domain-containing protein n=1 Tax=Lacticaseibacillus pabuli TaxID=3025672 RepID=A0ABY7WTI9_9LACO|nr:hypothetical protein [Lacticaseibacillus sp. KACC 23028]WDF82475.1 hypothetical protein PQ472_11360 [Lacticaseibacillus sp. KACC 23028]
MKKNIALIAAALLAASPVIAPAMNTMAATAKPDTAAAANAAFPHAGAESLENGVVTVAIIGKGAPVYSTYKDSAKTSRYLPYGSSWKYRGVVKYTDGSTWFDLGGNQWVKYGDLIHGTLSKQSGTLKINYVPGYAIAVWNNYEYGQFTGKRLKHGTSWKYFKIVYADNGKVMYNVGGNQWIDGHYVKVMK